MFTREAQAHVQGCAHVYYKISTSTIRRHNALVNITAVCKRTLFTIRVGLDTTSWCVSAEPAPAAVPVPKCTPAPVFVLVPVPQSHV